MPYLLIVDPNGKEEQIELEGARYTVGRDPSCAVVLPNKKVSRQHARIFAKGNSYWIEDLGSSNGVVIEGAPIRGPRKLGSNVIAEIGGFSLRVFEPEQEEDAAFSLLGMTPPFSNQSFMLPRGDLNVGRTEGNAIVLPDSSVSRRHAVLAIRGDSAMVKDLESSNGTWVNNVRVGQRELHVGDRVRFGNIEFEFLRPGDKRVSTLLPRVWGRFKTLERPIQVAVGIGILSLMLLVATVIVAVVRGSGGGLARARSGISLQEAYNKKIQADLEAAQEKMQAEAWHEAGELFKSILDRDPINKEARRGRRTAVQNQKDWKRVEQARQLLNNKATEQALDVATKVASDAHYAKQAASIADKARRQLARELLNTANKACDDSDWKRCHDLAVRALEHERGSEHARALIAKSESAMRSRGIGYTPWQPRKR